MTVNPALAFVLGFILWLWSCGESGPSLPGTEPPVVEGAKVETVAAATVEDTFDAVGTVQARRTAVLSSKVVGRVLSILVREGDRVRSGQVLVEIDSRDLRAELKGAEAAVREAEAAIGAAESAIAAAREHRELAAATFERYRALMTRESITLQEYDEASARYKVATAELARAEENLRSLRAKRDQARARVSYLESILTYTVLTAPFDAVVTEKPGEVGMLAAPGTPLLSVEETSSYRLEVQVGESRIARVKPGGKVPVMIDAVKDALSGAVVEIIPAADPQSRTFTVKIALPSRPAIRSGLYGKARFSEGQRRIVAVPIGAVVSKGQLDGVFVVDREEMARFRLVKTGKRYDERVEILSGLDPGERIVVEGAGKLRDGVRIG